eukprot:SM000225S07020  [mRNA]  locus=s225:120356:123276:+ [translate_table: standard]
MPASSSAASPACTTWAVAGALTTTAHHCTAPRRSWEPNSFGYHGDDGQFHGRGKPEGGDVQFPFTTGDTVGAGINFVSQEIFFTKNGKLLGPTFKDVQGGLYPTIGLHSPNERHEPAPALRLRSDDAGLCSPAPHRRAAGGMRVEVNFGQRPFLFNVEAMIQEERARRQRAIESVPLPLQVSHSLVRDYLLHHGYQETLVAFDLANGTPDSEPRPSPEEQNGGLAAEANVDAALEHRRVIRQLIRAGEVDGALAKLLEWYPQLVQEEKSDVSFLLTCQRFLEMIKKAPLDKIILYARTMLPAFRGSSPARDKHLEDCLALLAYEHPEASPVGHLLSVEQREGVADTVNVAILALGGPEGAPPPQSLLERLLRQLSTCHVEKRLASGGGGEVFELHRVLQGSKESGW